LAAERRDAPGRAAGGVRAAATVFSCRGLGYSYLDRFPALRGIDLEVRRGEKVVLLGANGCGKSTLLKVLAGLVFCTAGTVEAFGEPLTERSLEDAGFSRAFRSRVQIVFQNSDAQVFSPTVREEIAFGCLQMGLDPRATGERTDDALALLGIEDLAGRTPFQLSDGQRKRVAIASVLAMNPQVLLLDEPTAALDPRTRHRVGDLVTRLHAAGRTVVLATHDLDAVDTRTDRAVVLGPDHTVLRDAPAAGVLSDPGLLHRADLVHRPDPG